MVSFWPWKVDDTSPASFEKALSALSAKIARTSSRLDSLRQRSRRLNVLWTLYSGFAYLLCTVVLVLVVGWRKWGIAEYAGIMLGPAIIYLVRLALRTYYDYRTSTVQGQLDDLEKQRNETIERLKNATKYNSTQELLKKYGGTPTPKDKPARKPEGKSPTQQNKSNMPQNDRTNIAPPPTANIPGRIHVPSPQGTPQHFPPQKMSSPQSQSPRNWQGPVSPQEPGEDFAPNAFAAPLQYAQAQEGPRWYDRLMDVLMGEDESLPGKRLALICKNCRLVNGQAPPGVLRLEDVGKWRCAGCGTTNGEESEVRKLVASMKDETPLEEVPHATSSKTEEKEDAEDEDSESDVTQYSSEEERAKKPAAEAETPRRRSTRVKKSIQEAD